ncbi:MAG: cell division control protein Cdc6 [Candidatus Aenigmatarchaeota archaeon]|nr:MAG: cell division control protein Cdc6 [Candidatus Aenigmarchaeota archaeon]
MQLSLDNIFKNYIQKDDIFQNKELLLTKYRPENLPHREKEIKTLGSILAPSLRGEKPSNVFVYGKTGTGKTAVTQYVCSKLEEVAMNNGHEVRIIYLNCKMRKVADTEYRLLAKLARELGRDVPPTGLPTDQVYEIFFEAVEDKKRMVILILDEIDIMVEKTGDNFLYNLTRMNEDLENSKISIIGISNNLSFKENLDPRVRSSLSEEEMLFSPYNALQLQDILKSRAEKAFKPGVIAEGVIEKCAALAAQEHGDARRALDLLRVAGEMCEREGSKRVEERHVDMAESKIDMDRILEVVRTQPRQSQAVLWSILKLKENGGNEVQTGDIFSVYEKVCRNSGLAPLTQRRVSDLIAELDLLGIINARVISKGRYGRTRTITLGVSEPILEKIKNTLVSEFYFE